MIGRMTTRVAMALRAVRLVAERTDPLEPIALGAIATHLGVSLSSASRLCADLESVGLLGRAAPYGSYGLGLRAVRLSGRAAAPLAQTVRLALTHAAQQTGETVCVAARAGSAMMVVAAVVSAWTLYAPAEVGEIVSDGDSAIARAEVAARDPRSIRLFESQDGMRMEIAAPVRDRSGETVAVVACRLPRNRTRSAAARARRAVVDARALIESAMSDAPPAPPADTPEAESARVIPAVEAIARVLEHLPRAGRAVDLAHATGLSMPRTHRLLQSLVDAGLAHRVDDGAGCRLSWSVHAWHRACRPAILTGGAEVLVEQASEATGQCAFVTVLRGMRSVTVVEKLAPQPPGLAMTPWLGRPCPIVHADAGPTLLLDFEPDDIPALIPGRPVDQEVSKLLRFRQEVAVSDVLAKESLEEGGQIAVSAPVRDSSGLVVAASLIVGPTEVVRHRVNEMEAAAVALATDVSTLLGADGWMPPRLPTAGSAAALPRSQPKAVPRTTMNR